MKKHYTKRKSMGMVSIKKQEKLDDYKETITSDPKQEIITHENRNK